MANKTINWKVRVKNKTFWLVFIPAIMVLIQVVAKAFGFEIDLTQTQDNLIDIVNAVFGVLIVLGVVTDPTTTGVSDSTQALTYEKPKSKE